MPAESNLMHNINGLMFGNNIDFLCKGENVRWYLMAYGTETDMHTAHWHGQTGMLMACVCSVRWLSLSQSPIAPVPKFPVLNSGL